MHAPTPSVPAVTVERLRSILIAELAEALNVAESEIDTARQFDEFGLDSTDAVVVVGRVEDRLNIELNPELLLEHRCVDAVVQALAERLNLA